MAGNREERTRIMSDLPTNLMNIIHERSEAVDEDTTPNASPRRGGSPLPDRSITKFLGKTASTSVGEETPPAIKKLLETWLTDTLTSVLHKPIQDAAAVNARTCAAPPVDEQHDQPPPPPTTTGITHNVVNNAGDDALTAILKRMEEMENENKALRDQMRENQERVNKIPGAPKLLPKRDAGRFVKQLYSDSTAPHVIPKTFKMLPYLKIYDGTTDPEDHVTHHVTDVKGNDLAKEQVSSILLKKFGETLTGGALTWYSQLPAHSIETFEEMADKFVTAHAGAKKAEARVNDIFAIKESPREGLRDFLARFNRVRMTLPNVSERMAVAAFQNGLSINGSRATRKLLSWLMKYSPTTWDEIHNAYCAELRADEDDLNGPTHRLTSVQAESRKDRRNDIRKNPVASRPNRERNLPYVRTHKLKRSITHERYDGIEESIIFDKSDTNGLAFPHCDALVITLRILDIDVRRIMVDDGSGACIIHPRVLAQMKLEDKIVPRCITLTGFNNAVERTSGEITLPVLAGGVTLETTFHITDKDTTYNAIIGRPWIHTMRAIPSSLYQVIKFPTPWGIFSIRGEQCTSQEFYRIALDCTATQ
ncbi:uncharacterized protein [Nicotiana tomentosiformis]|uniref:uncharacterized protein n=1 Tax=Nicotiana tomentosiformis TaxID=4098 RepID=UPI00388C3E16